MEVRNPLISISKSSLIWSI